MPTSQNAAVGANVLSRRVLLGGLGIAAMIAASLPADAGTGAAEDVPAEGASGAAATIRRFNDALIASMRSAGRTGFNQRFDVLAPVVERTFDLPAVLAVSVGPAWAGLSQDQQNRLLDAFRRYTVATYVANFDSYSGQSFTVSPDTRSVGAGRVVVDSRITPADGDATEIDYVMQQTAAGWKVVDVLAAGSISRVAVQRSDFRHLLSKGGGEALLASLQRKTSELSGGAVA